MAYYADLTPYTYFAEGSQGGVGLWRRVPLVNVGWLGRGRRFSKGEVPAGLAEALKRMTRTHRAEQTRGFHLCPWCDSRVFRARADCPRGSAEIRVKGDGIAYAAPELVAHYVASHGYLPPAEFVQSVFSSGNSA